VVWWYRRFISLHTAARVWRPTHPPYLSYSSNKTWCCLSALVLCLGKRIGGLWDETIVHNCQISISGTLTFFLMNHYRQLLFCNDIKAVNIIIRTESLLFYNWISIIFKLNLYSNIFFQGNNRKYIKQVKQFLLTQ